MVSKIRSFLDSEYMSPITEPVSRVVEKTLGPWRWYNNSDESGFFTSRGFFNFSAIMIGLQLTVPLAVPYVLGTTLSAAVVSAPLPLLGFAVGAGVVAQTFPRLALVPCMGAAFAYGCVTQIVPGVIDGVKDARRYHAWKNSPEAKHEAALREKYGNSYIKPGPIQLEKLEDVDLKNKIAPQSGIFTSSNLATDFAASSANTAARDATVLANDVQALPSVPFKAKAPS